MSGFNFGQVSEFSDPNSIQYPIIAGLARTIKMPAFKGALYQMMKPPLVAIKGKEFEIYSRSKTARNGLVGTGGWDNSAITGLPVDTTMVKGLTLGTVLQVEAEIVVVSAVQQGAGTVSVFKRGAASTTAAAHTAGKAIKVIGYAIRDTDLKNVTGVQEGTLKYTNYVQTFAELLDWTKGAELMRKGLSAENTITVLQQEAAIRLAETLSVSALYGQKQQGNVGGDQYMSAGLLQQLVDTAGGTRPTLTYAAAGALTETKLRAALKDVTKFGQPSVILCSMTNKELINGFNATNAAVKYNIALGEKTAGYEVKEYNYNGLILQVVVDADMPDDQVAVLSPDGLRKGWLEGDELRPTVEPTQSTRERREALQGSLGFLIEGVGYDHTLITGIA
jgi:hypothetical protein